jgi:hypothetical protein
MSELNQYSETGSGLHRPGLDLAVPPSLLPLLPVKGSPQKSHENSDCEAWAGVG